MSISMIHSDKKDKKAIMPMIMFSLMLGAGMSF